jgi:hypothetical protein
MECVCINAGCSMPCADWSASGSSPEESTADCVARGDGECMMRGITQAACTAAQCGAECSGECSMGDGNGRGPACPCDCNTCPGTCEGADTTVQVRAPLAHPPRPRPCQGSVALPFQKEGCRTS